jgi:hypothetical protein
MEEIDKIVKTLPELWETHRRTNGKDLGFADAVWMFAEKMSQHNKGFSINRVGRSSAGWWNEAIDLLDDNYPGWRGYPNPEYIRQYKLEKV